MTMRRAAAGIVFVGAIICTILLIRRSSSSDDPSGRSASHGPSGSATTCDGVFSVQLPSERGEGAAQATLLDAAFDARPAYAAQKNVRTIALTLAVPGRAVKVLLASNVSASVQPPDRTREGVMARVVALAPLPQDARQQTGHKSDAAVCAPGSRRCVFEMRVDLSAPDDPTAIDARVTALRGSGALLHLTIAGPPSHTHASDAKEGPSVPRKFAKLRLSLGCLADGENFTPARLCSVSRSALIIFAPALSRNSSDSELHGAARVAAASLAAPRLAADAVALPVVVPHGQSAIDSNCHSGRFCRADRLATDAGLVARVRNAVHEAVKEAGLPPGRAADVRLVPVCALGDHDECPAEAALAAIAASVAPRFRWSAVLRRGNAPGNSSGGSGAQIVGLPLSQKAGDNSGDAYADFGGRRTRLANVLDTVVRTALQQTAVIVRVPKLKAVGWLSDGVRQAMRNAGIVGVRGGSNGSCLTDKKEEVTEFARCNRLVGFAPNGLPVTIHPEDLVIVSGTTDGEENGASAIAENQDIVDSSSALAVWSDDFHKEERTQCATFVAEKE